jgi:hypothetical protein
MSRSMSRAIRLGLGSLVQGREHSLESDQAVADGDELLDEAPIECRVNPETQPLAAAIGRHKELRIPRQPLDIAPIQSERDRRPPAELLKSYKCFFARDEIRMAKGVSFHSFRQGKAEGSQLEENSLR